MYRWLWMAGFGLLLAASAPPAAAHEQAEAESCEGTTTLEINACFAARLERAEERMNRYLQAALQNNAGAPSVAAAIEASQQAFLAYRNAECGAVYEDWKDGTIRTVMALSCQIELTDRRTRTIWRNWLTYMDSTPPLLPEPDPAE